jgi:hypothetical protein
VYSRKEVVMKNNTISLNVVWLLVLRSIIGLIILSGGSIFCVTSVEKDRARQQISILKSQIKAEEDAYKLAVQLNAEEIEKDQLTVQYKQARKKLFQQIAQQKELVGDNVGITQNWLWNAAKVVGTVALMGFAVYSFFQASPAKITNPPTFIDLDVNKSTEVVNESFEKVSEVNNNFQPTREDLRGFIASQDVNQFQNVTPKMSLERYEKYKNASNAYGTATVWFSLAAFINPVFVPYAMATYVGSLYYGAKALQPNVNLNPISLEHIKIIPEELPY